MSEDPPTRARERVSLSVRVSVSYWCIKTPYDVGYDLLRHTSEPERLGDSIGVLRGG